MFLRKKKNVSGSISIQVISKAKGKYKVLKSIGAGNTNQEIEKLWYIGLQEIERLKAQTNLFISKADTIVDQVFETLENASIRTIGPELIFGKIYDHIGFNEIGEDLFKHLHNMYEVSYILPDSRQMKSSLLKMDDSQAELHRLVLKNY